MIALAACTPSHACLPPILRGTLPDLPSTPSQTFRFLPGCGKTTLLGSIAGSAMDLGSRSVLTGSVEVDGVRCPRACKPPTSALRCRCDPEAGCPLLCLLMRPPH